MCFCVRVRVSKLCVRACVRVCVCVRARARARVCVCVWRGASMGACECCLGNWQYVYG